MKMKEQQSHSEAAMNIESGFVRSSDERIAKETPVSAHVTGTDGWQQASLLLVTAFCGGWVLSFSRQILVPLGWAWGIPVMFLFGLFIAYAQWLMAGFHFIDGRRFIRFRDIMGFLFGREMYHLTWILQFLTMFLGNMGFILLGGHALKEMNLAFGGFTLRLQYLIIITGVAYCIFSFVVPNISAMKVWLGVSMFFTFTFITVLLIGLVNDGKSNGHRDYTVRGSTADKLFNGLGAISALMACNTSGMLPEIQSTLRDPAVKNMRRANFIQFTAGLIVYYGVIIAGYWAYGSEVSDYLPRDLTGPKWAKILINLAVFLQNVVSQHMFIQPVHEALDTRFLKLDKGAYSKENLRRRFVLRALLYAANTFIAAAIPFIGDFIGLLGSFTLTVLTFVFPSMIFIKVKGKTAGAGHKAWHWGIIIVFSLLSVLTTLSAVISIIKNVRQYHLFADK